MRDPPQEEEVMRVLVVEDNLERQAAFREHYVGCVIAANYAPR